MHKSTPKHSSASKGFIQLQQWGDGVQKKILDDACYTFAFKRCSLEGDYLDVLSHDVKITHRV